jgi:hypothetical protein
LRSTLWSTASRFPAAGSSRRPRACATVRPAGSDLDWPSTSTVTQAPRSSSPPSAIAISVAVSHSSSHARRVSRSLPVEVRGVRRRPRSTSRGWWSWVELVGACSQRPHHSGWFDQHLNTMNRQLVANCTSSGQDPSLWVDLSPERIRRHRRSWSTIWPHAQHQHAGWQPDGAWAVPDDLAVDPLPLRPGHAVRCGRSSRPGQVEQHHGPLGLQDPVSQQPVSGAEGHCPASIAKVTPAKDHAGFGGIHPKDRHDASDRAGQ